MIVSKFDKHLERVKNTLKQYGFEWIRDCPTHDDFMFSVRNHMFTMKDIITIEKTTASKLVHIVDNVALFKWNSDMVELDRERKKVYKYLIEQTEASKKLCEELHNYRLSLQGGKK